MDASFCILPQAATRLGSSPGDEAAMKLIRAAAGEGILNLFLLSNQPGVGVYVVLLAYSIPRKRHLGEVNFNWKGRLY